MIWILAPHDRGRVAAPLLVMLLFLVAGGVAGCSDPLDVSDPTTILDGDVNNAEGAELLRRSVLKRLYTAVGTSALESGLLADEFLNQPSEGLEQRGVRVLWEMLDRRATAELVDLNPVLTTNSYQQWQELQLRAAPVALAKLRAYAAPGAREAHVGEMFAVRGYAMLRLAEDVCPGFPLHDLVDYKVVYSPPLSTEQAFELALAAFDSAASWAADSVRVLNFARVGRARTLLNLGRYADAIVAAAEVPTEFVAEAEYNTSFDPPQPNILAADQPGWAFEDFVAGTYSVADREGGNGLDFVAAVDPRVPTIPLGTARDGVTTLYGVATYADAGAPIAMAGGVEARLIEAEAALNAGDAGTWLARLNQLRQTVGLPDTTDPGTAAARIDLTFRERAFWLFATGHRLGDLRRLIRQYGRTSESVFPTGAYWRGGTYATGTSMPLPSDESTFSPGVTGCTGF